VLKEQAASSMNYTKILKTSHLNEYWIFNIQYFKLASIYSNY